MTIYKKWDIVLVPFPFTDLTLPKRRPALVISPDDYNQAAQDLVIAFITSRAATSPRRGDHRISFWRESGLPMLSLLLMKIATVACRIVSKKIGALHKSERDPVRNVLSDFFL
jgi:mRNA interferase MazF